MPPSDLKVVVIGAQNGIRSHVDTGCVDGSRLYGMNGWVIGSPNLRHPFTLMFKNEVPD